MKSQYIIIMHVQITQNISVSETEIGATGTYAGTRRKPPLVLNVAPAAS